MIEENQKRKTSSIVSMFALGFFVLIATFAYAYFTANTTITNNLIISANVTNTAVPVFTAYPSDDLNLTVSTADMLETSLNDDSSKSIAASDTQTLNVSLIGGSFVSPVVCYFDLVWVDKGDIYIPSSGVTDENPEYTIEISQYKIPGGPALGEFESKTINVSNLVSNADSNRKVIIYDDVIVDSNGSLREYIILIKAKIYNLNFGQTIYNKKFTSTFVAEDFKCR